jgi:hypothetical protein
MIMIIIALSILYLSYVKQILSTIWMILESDCMNFHLQLTIKNNQEGSNITIDIPCSNILQLFTDFTHMIYTYDIALGNQSPTFFFFSVFILFFWFQSGNRNKNLMKIIKYLSNLKKTKPSKYTL